MKKDPTPAQVRFHYYQVQRLHHKLSKALWAAKEAGVIVFPEDEARECDPAWGMFDIDVRFDRATEKQLANAMRTEIMKKVYK